MDRNGARENTGTATAKEEAVKKKRIRLDALARRDSLTAEQRRDYSGRIVKNLTSLPCYREADAILTYISFRSEVDTFSLLKRAFADGKAVFAPKVLGKEMAFYQISSPEDLAEGYCGILEPSCGYSYDEWADGHMGQRVLICLPGTAFDRARHRIGYGGGFYDRFLNRLPGDASAHLRMTCVTAALAYDCQIFEEIPCEAHDIYPMCVVTEKEVLR